MRVLIPLMHRFDSKPETYSCANLFFVYVNVKKSSAETLTNREAIGGHLESFGKCNDGYYTYINPLYFKSDFASLIRHGYQTSAVSL